MDPMDKGQLPAPMRVMMRIKGLNEEHLSETSPAALMAASAHCHMCKFHEDCLRAIRQNEQRCPNNFRFEAMRRERWD